MCNVYKSNNITKFSNITFVNTQIYKYYHCIVYYTLVICLHK